MNMENGVATLRYMLDTTAGQVEKTYYHTLTHYTLHRQTDKNKINLLLPNYYFFPFQSIKYGGEGNRKFEENYNKGHLQEL